MYEEIRKRSPKTPYDYFALAHLADVVDNPLRFAGWLLSGLKEHPRDVGLYSLFAEYCRSRVPIKVIPDLLIVASRVVNDDRFYYLTERLWDRLLRRESFDDFRETLYGCEGNLVDHQIGGRLTFYVHIYKAALWKAGEEWLKDATELLDENYEDVPYNLQDELDLIDFLKGYRKSRSRFLTGDPVRARLDSAIFDYCTKDEIDGDRAFLECQQWIADHGEMVLKSIPPRKGEAKVEFAEFYYAWQFIANDVDGRVAEVDTMPVENGRIDVRTDVLLLDLKEQMKNPGVLEQIWIVAVLLYCLGAVTAMGLLVFRVFNSRWDNPSFLEYGGVLSGVLWGMGALVALDSRIRRYQYKKLWRRQVLNFLAQTHITWEDLVQEIESIDLKEMDYEFGEFLKGDDALKLFSTAQYLLR